VAALICSLVFCIPLVTQLVGLVLGIVGIAHTSDGQRRGRGLAVAAVIISPLAILGWIVVGFLVYAFFMAVVGIGESVRPLLASESPTAEAVADMYGDHFSARLKQRVDEAGFTDFLSRVRERYGRATAIQSANPPFSQTSDGQGIILHLQARFGDQYEKVNLTLGFMGMTPEIDNFTVGELAINEPPPAASQPADSNP